MSRIGRAPERKMHGIMVQAGFGLATIGDTSVTERTRPTNTWGTDNPPTHSEVDGSAYLCLGATDPKDMWWIRIAGAWVRAFPASSLVWYGGSVTPAAYSTTAVHAANGDDIQTWPAPSDPDVPRNLVFDFGAAWAGGNPTAVGLDAFGNAASETIVAVPGSVVAGTKIFASVSAITHPSAGPGGAGHTASAGYGNKIGVATAIAAVGGILTLDDVSEIALWDRTYSSFEPSTPPNGARVYRYAVIG